MLSKIMDACALSWGLLCLISPVVLVIEPKLSQATQMLHLKIHSIRGRGV